MMLLRRGPRSSLLSCQPVFLRQRGEEWRRGRIRSNPSRHDHTGTPTFGNKTREQFGEERIGVHISSACAWEVAAVLPIDAGKDRGRLGSALGSLELLVGSSLTSTRHSFLEPGNHAGLQAHRRQPALQEFGMQPRRQRPASWSTRRNRARYGFSAATIVSGSVATDVRRCHHHRRWPRLTRCLGCHE